MALRFTEFVKLEGKEIGLYIIQEPDLVCFKILVYVLGETLLIKLKKNGEKWEIMPQGYPIWIDAMLPSITTTITRRFFVELN